MEILHQIGLTGSMAILLVLSLIAALIVGWLCRISVLEPFIKIQWSLYLAGNLALWWYLNGDVPTALIEQAVIGVIVLVGMIVPLVIVTMMTEGKEQVSVPGADLRVGATPAAELTSDG